MSPEDAYTILNLLPGIGPIRVRQLLSVYDAPQDILDRPVAELSSINGVGPKLADKLANWRQHVDLEQELRTADRAGVRILALSDPDYPELLAEIHDPPLVLYVRGQTSVLSRASQLGLAVVGSRRHTHYGITCTERLTRSAVHAGWVIVSGLARGIDTAAHRATVEMDGCTIAVLAGGIAQLYPPENQDLARDLCAKGALISEQPMLMKPDKRAFPMRNRIIAGLCRATLVIEAGDRSGALITAQQALEQGRLVYAVPGRIDSPHSAGCHRLIKEGAKLVESLDDIQEDVSFLPGFDLFDSLQSEPEPRPAPAPAIDLSDAERQLIELLRESEQPIDLLVEKAAQPVASVLATLSILELKRLVRQLPGRRYALYTN